MLKPDLLETLQRQPAPRPAFVSSPAVAKELQMLRDYGPKYSIRCWEDRPAAEQEAIEIALSAFQNWRINHVHEDLPDILRLYMSRICYKSRPWRDRTVAALRLYFLAMEEPTLFRLVEAPLARE